jgi:thiamine-phosphate pyrophosphorylase
MGAAVNQSVLRIIDANLNRTAEGLRVLEDIARLGLNHAPLSADLKAMRHGLVRTDSFVQDELVWSRDAAADVGRDTLVPGENPGQEVPSVLVANSRRAQESLRVLEEMTKTPDGPPGLNSESFKEARFRLYAIEQQLLGLLRRQDKLSRLTGLYVIVDGQGRHGLSPADITRQAVRGGARIIQLREKTVHRKDLLPVARTLRQICAEMKVLFIVNDYLDVALDVKADGLHVGQDDLPVAAARRLLRPDQLLGCSASTVAEALAAQSAGADHIAVGSVFATSTKVIDVVGIDRLTEIQRAVSAPVVAIGGINRGNAAQVMAAGATAAAVISAVVDAADPESAARALANTIEEK